MIRDYIKVLMAIEPSRLEKIVMGALLAVIAITFIKSELVDPFAKRMKMAQQYAYLQESHEHLETLVRLQKAKAAEDKARAEAEVARWALGDLADDVFDGKISAPALIRMANANYLTLDEFSMAQKERVGGAMTQPLFVGVSGSYGNIEKYVQALTRADSGFIIERLIVLPFENKISANIHGRIYETP